MNYVGRKKDFELIEEELEKVTGGIVRGGPSYTVQAGYYRYKYAGTDIYHLPSNVTGSATKRFELNVYVLDQTTGFYVNSNTTHSDMINTFQNAFEKIADVSSYTFVG